MKPRIKEIKKQSYKLNHKTLAGLWLN